VDGLLFVIVGLVLSAGIAIVIQRRGPVVLRLSAAVALCALLYVLLTLEVHTLGNEPPWYQSSPMKEIIYFLVMVLGMFARLLSVAIEKRREKNAERASILSNTRSLDIDIWESIYPLLFSVITFGALLGQIGDAQLGVATVVLSFQTGFFWQTIIKNQKGA
jgi:hypothetical protein